MDGLSHKTFTDLVSTHCIIFSCGVCQRTLDELYPLPGPGEHLHRPRTEGARLWITDCSHVTCSEHIEGGGVPFHPEGSHPRAPCPICLNQKGDGKLRKLFAIRGRERGNHDSVIPGKFFRPVIDELDDSDETGAALKFQYLSIARFGAMMHKRFDLLRKNLNAVNKENFRHAEELRQKEFRILKFREEVDGLRAVERKYNMYKQRTPEITRYVNGYAALVRENSSLKSQLNALGYEVPGTSWSPLSEDQAADLLRSEPSNAANGTPKSRSSPLFVPEHSSRKRARDEEHEGDDFDGLPAATRSNRQNRTTSGELMPPPPLPSQSQHSSGRLNSRLGSSRRDGMKSVGHLDIPLAYYPARLRESSVSMRSGVTEDHAMKDFDLEDHATGERKRDIAHGHMPSFERQPKESSTPQRRANRVSPSFNTAQRRSSFERLGSSQLYTNGPDPGAKEQYSNSFYTSEERRLEPNHLPSIWRHSPVITPHIPSRSVTRPPTVHQARASLRPLPPSMPLIQTRSSLDRSSSPLPRHSEALTNNSLNALSFMNNPYNSKNQAIHIEDATRFAASSNILKPRQQANFDPPHLHAAVQPQSFAVFSDGSNKQITPFRMASDLSRPLLAQGNSKTHLGSAFSPETRASRRPPPSSGTLVGGLFQRYADHDRQAGAHHDRHTGLGSTRPGTRTQVHSSLEGPLKQGIRSSRGLTTANDVYRNRQKLTR